MGSSCSRGKSKHFKGNVININQLPLDVLEKIFLELDNASKWNVIIASKYWEHIFVNSSKLLNSFSLEINENNLVSLLKAWPHPQIPLKSIFFSGLQDLDKSSMQFQKLLMLLSSLNTNSVEHVAFTGVNFASTEEIFIILKEFPSISEIGLLFTTVYSGRDEWKLPYIPTLKKIEVIGSKALMSSIFSQQKSVEDLMIPFLGMDRETTSMDFYMFIKNYPNLKSLRLDMSALPLDFSLNGFFDKLEKLFYSGMTFPFSDEKSIAKFSKSGLPKLKELRLVSFNFEYADELNLKHIIEDMGLETFYYVDSPLILNGQKQPIREFSIENADQIGAIYEMFRQFPTIQTFKLKISMLQFIDEEQADSIYNILNEWTELFENVKELIIKDTICNGLILAYVGLFRNCRNVEKLVIESNNDGIDLILIQFLSHMQQLEEFSLNSTTLKIHGMTTIRNDLPNLKKLSVNKNLVHQMKVIMDNKNNVEIIGLEPTNDP